MYCISMVKLTQVCEMMQKYHRPGIKRVLTTSIDTSAYIPSSAFLVQRSAFTVALTLPSSGTVCVRINRNLL